MKRKRTVIIIAMVILLFLLIPFKNSTYFDLNTAKSKKTSTVFGVKIGEVISENTFSKLLLSISPSKKSSEWILAYSYEGNLFFSVHSDGIGGQILFEVLGISQLLDKKTNIEEKNKIVLRLSDCIRKKDYKKTRAIYKELENEMMN